MKYIIVNNLHFKPEPIIIFESNSDSELIDFVKAIAIENEDYETSILGFSNATEYIEEFCANLDFYDEELFWQELGDVPINEDDELDDDFLIFDSGTDKVDVWNWFEETFDTQIGGKYL